MDLNIGEICRGCLAVGPDVQCSFTWPGVRDLFSNCTQLQIPGVDVLPQQICFQCYTKCQEWNVFQLMCKESEQILLEKLTLKQEKDKELESVQLTQPIEMPPCRVKIEEMDMVQVSQEQGVKIEAAPDSPKSPERRTIQRIKLESSQEVLPVKKTKRSRRLIKRKGKYTSTIQHETKILSRRHKRPRAKRGNQSSKVIAKEVKKWEVGWCAICEKGVRNPDAHKKTHYKLDCPVAGCGQTFTDIAIVSFHIALHYAGGREEVEGEQDSGSEGEEDSETIVLSE